MLAVVLKIGTPGYCCWAGDFGEELRILATVLKATIVVFSKCLPAQKNKRQSYYFLSSEYELKHLSYYEPLTGLYEGEGEQERKIPILFENGNHFQALLPPNSINSSMIPKWPSS